MNNLNSITVFSFRTGSHTFSENQVWDEHDGPAFIGTFMNRAGRQIPVVRPVAGLAWNGSPTVSEAFRLGALDEANPRVRENSLMTALFSRLDARLGLRIDKLEAKAKAEKAAKAAQIKARGAWLVASKTENVDCHTVHHSLKEALKAAERPSEEAEIWQGDFALHTGGWVTSKGKKYLRQVL